MSVDTSEVSTVKVDDGVRLFNTGVSVKLKKLGDIQVKELTLENLILLSKDIVILINSMTDSTKGTKDGIAWLSFLLETPETMEAVKKVAAASTGIQSDLFTDMGIGDWLKWMTAFKQVTDWEEIRELFFQLLPMEMSFKNLLSQKA